MASAEGLHLTLVVSYVFNAFLCLTSILLNIITIQAVRITSSLPKTLKTLLLSLAVSDLGVGLLAQPLYVAILLMEIDQNTNSTAYNSVYKAYVIQKKIIVMASHFGVFALTVDRFLAIHLHLRYQELVTHKRVVAVVMSVWVLSASISILRGLSHDPFIYASSDYSRLCPNYRIALLQDIRSRETPNKPDASSSTTSTTSDTE